MRGHLRPVHPETIGKLGAQGLRHVGHAVEFGDAAVVDPLEQLLGPESWFAHVGQKGVHVLPVHADQVRAGIRGAANRRRKRAAGHEILQFGRGFRLQLFRLQILGGGR